MELLSHLKYNSNLRSLLMFPFDFESDENIGEQSVCTRMYVISGPITTAQGLYFEQFDMDSYQRVRHSSISKNSQATPTHFTFECQSKVQNQRCNNQLEWMLREITRTLIKLEVMKNNFMYIGV